MIYEIYYKTGFGRRARKITSTVGLRHVIRNLWTSITGYGQAPAYQVPTATITPALPITGDAAGTAKATFDIQFHGQDIPTGGKMATVTYNVGAGDQTIPVPLQAGDTPNQATNKIVTAINGVAELSAVKGAGTTVVVTPTSGTVLSTLTLAVA